MADRIEKEIESLLGQGQRKANILARLEGDQAQRPKVVFYLNNISMPGDRKKYQLYNLVLAGLLTFVTAKKLIATFSFGKIDLFLLISLIVPAVNIYLLREILRFRRLGYQFLFVVSVLAMVHPENHFIPEATMQVAIIVLSGFLYVKLFPTAKMIK
ncbi:MAG: hypothetical protein OEY01_07725 [Desulfobulbaceae bacterium]|nr:hypothetical protein [Desulfobulbaceae bacterium]HIJ78944.1 hypothetical protein [Deltaproteobacteria bacterium]